MSEMQKHILHRFVFHFFFFLSVKVRGWRICALRVFNFFTQKRMAAVVSMPLAHLQLRELFIGTFRLESPPSMPYALLLDFLFETAYSRMVLFTFSTEECPLQFASLSSVSQDDEITFQCNF